MEKKTDVCLIFGLIYSTIQIVCKNGTKFISDFERNGSRIKQFRDPERSDIDESQFKWFKQRLSDIIQW